MLTGSVQGAMGFQRAYSELTIITRQQDPKDRRLQEVQNLMSSLLQKPCHVEQINEPHEPLSSQAPQLTSVLSYRLHAPVAFQSLWEHTFACELPRLSSRPILPDCDLQTQELPGR